MRKQTIQQPERYEAPKVKVKELRKRTVLAASEFTIGGDTEVTTTDTGE